MARVLEGGRSLILAALVAVLAGAGCDGDDRALGRDDVTGLPPGTAVGTTFSGSYLAESATIASCTCRVGSCAGITVNAGSITTVIQQDGRLTVTDANGGASVGGVDADGTFWAGSAIEQPGFTVYARTDGQFVLVNGQPDFADFTATATELINMTGIHFDCDLSIAGRLRYQGP